jgi:tRNA nucleotidyltransferase/poly(A) polymerase
MTTEQRIKFDLVIPEDIKLIQSVFKENGFKLFVVGGAVRDALLGKTPKDFDLATDAVPDKVEEMMKAAGLNTIGTGKAFGVINVFTSDGEYEIATFRTDIGKGRRPDSVEFTTIEGDVNRRDLTINALFFDIDTNEVVDLVGGIEDLKNGVIRTVGAPEDRFDEDRLRILRAIRFAARFGNELDPAINAALKKDASLEGISSERIRDEFIKGLKSAKLENHFFEMLNKYGLFEWIFKGLEFDSTIGRVSYEYNHDDYIVLLATLLKKNNVDLLKKTLNKLKYSVDEIKAITFLISMLSLDVDTGVSLKRQQQHAGVTESQILDFCLNENMNGQLLDGFLEFKLSVTGQEVMDTLGLKEGPELGKAILRLETENFKKVLLIS